jgi:hypothetical protein
MQSKLSASGARHASVAHNAMRQLLHQQQPNQPLSDRTQAYVCRTHTYMQTADEPGTVHLIDHPPTTTTRKEVVH